MQVTILKEAGYTEALLGLSLNKNQPLRNMRKVADKLAHKQGGHNKFLESIVVWIDVTAPRYWWAEFDTYRVGVTKQSESTMHTITKRPLTLDDFEGMAANSIGIIQSLNNLIDQYNNADTPTGKTLLLVKIKRLLPESFLQRRVVCTNYKTLQNMYYQRHAHRLPEWSCFCYEILQQAEQPEWISGTKDPEQ